MSWIVRPVVWFIVASIAITIVHELAHACTAFALGVRSTLFNYSANLDMTPAQAASHLPALIRIAGPLVSLAAGVGAWFAMKRARDSSAELPLVFLSAFGVGTFFGNLMSTSFVGDFSLVAAWLEWPMGLRVAVSIAGALGLVGVHVWAGRQLVRWVPAHTGRFAGVLGTVVVPVVMGMAVVILVNLPMANTTVSARIGEAGFWLFAVLGALSQRRDVPRFGGRLAPQWSDVVMASIALIVVRVLVQGIPFHPGA